MPINIAPRRTGMTIPIPRPWDLHCWGKFQCLFFFFNASLFSTCWKLLVGNVAIEICSLVSFGKGESWDRRSEKASINNQRQSGHDYSRQEEQLGNQNDFTFRDLWLCLFEHRVLTKVLLDMWNQNTLVSWTGSYLSQESRESWLLTQFPELWIHRSTDPQPLDWRED